MPSKANLGSFAKTHDEPILPDVDAPQPTERTIAPKAPRVGRPPKPAKEKRKPMTLYLSATQMEVLTRKAGLVNHSPFIVDFLVRKGFFDENE